MREAVWAVRHDASPHAVPVFVMGIQRSGTNMLLDGLAQAPETKIYNEDHPGAFENFQLRSDDVLRALVEKSRQRFVAFKALSDSHRTNELLDQLGTPSAGRAIWIYRSVEGRVRSVLAKWPENNRRVLREIAAGRRASHWEACGISDESLALIESIDYDAITQESAAALLWYVRNAIFFEHGLDRRDDVLLVSYDALIGDPEPTMRRVSAFLELPYRAHMIAHIQRRPPATGRQLAVDPAIDQICSELAARLEEARSGETRRSPAATLA